MMNATAPITSISRSLLNREDVRGTPLEDGIRAIFETSQHMSDFVANYRKMSELEKPRMGDVPLRAMMDDVSKAYPQLQWEIDVLPELTVCADAGMLRQVLMNLAKNAIEAQARKMNVVLMERRPDAESVRLCIGNDGLPIPAEARRSLFVPFFTTKRSGSGIGLSLSRRMMVQQGGMLDLADTPHPGCHVAFILSFV